MKSKGILIFIVIMLLVSSVSITAQAAFEAYDTESFGGSISTTEGPQPDNFNLYTTLTFNGSCNVTVQAGNQAPTITYPNPANQSTNVALDTAIWNATITNPDGPTFNWTITSFPNIGTNASNDDSNGSKNIYVSGNLTYSTQYLIWVNATDGNWTNKSYLFTTAEGALNVSTNYSIGIEEVNATLYGYLGNNDSLNTTCWFQWKLKSNDFTSPTGNVSVGTVAQGSTFSYNASPLGNGSLYYFRARANNSRGFNASYNSSYFLTKPQAATGVTVTPIGGGFNVSWTHGNGYNVSYLIFNTDHVPYSRTDGTYLDTGTHNYYVHTSLTPGQTYYYRVWEYANWGNPALYQWSDGNYSDSDTYMGNQPAFSNENPTNNSDGVSLSTVIWNITIESPKGRTFNWTIETYPNIGTNHSESDSNGSKNVNIAGNLTRGGVYKVWVNASEEANNNWTNETFYFTAAANFTVDSTLTFGGSCNVTGTNPILSEQPTNTSTDISLYPMLNLSITDPQGDAMNVSWSTNATGTWVYYNTTASGGTAKQRATFANESSTTYWWTVHVNDSEGYWTNETYHFTTASYTWGNWSAWWEFNYTCCAPGSFTATAYNQTAINLSWSSCDSADTNYLMVNESGWTTYPLSITNGTLLYNGTNITYNHTGLSPTTTYYYTIWGWNETDGNYSVINNTAYATTQGDTTVFGPYPANESTGQNRPPVNISIQINGSNLDIYYYYWNMSCWPNAYSLLYNWSTRSNGRYEVLNLDTNWSSSFTWGDHDYNWSVNISNASAWLNTSYIYTTKGSRYDVTNSGDVITDDISVTWANRTGGGQVYNGIYDVDSTGDIITDDISKIWAHRTG